MTNLLYGKETKVAKDRIDKPDNKKKKTFSVLTSL